MYTIKVRTRKRIELVDITSQVSSVLIRNNIQDGFCSLYVPHTTAGILVNESYDAAVSEDILNWLNTNVPFRSNYLHKEGNADAHIKSALVGNSITLFVEKGKLFLGRWQGIFFVECDGPREREVWIKIVNSAD